MREREGSVQRLLLPPRGRKLGRVRSVRLAAIVMVLLVAGSTPAVAKLGNAVGADQAFVGRVNGSFHHATIAMACFGPVYRETGHPMSGQTLEVLSPLPPTAVGPIHPGNTGSSATRIVAVLRGDPPIVLARFSRTHFQTRAIPTWWSCRARVRASCGSFRSRRAPPRNRHGSPCRSPANP